MGLTFSDPRCTPIGSGWLKAEDRICPVCGTGFTISCHEADWTYKINVSTGKKAEYVPVCRYNCQIAWDKEHEQKAPDPREKSPKARVHTPESIARQKEAMHRFWEMHGEDLKAAQRAAGTKKRAKKERGGACKFDPRELNRILYERSLMQKDLCELTGISRASICRYTNGKQIPRPRQIKSIAEALGIAPEDLMRKEDWRRNDAGLPIMQTRR